MGRLEMSWALPDKPIAMDPALNGDSATLRSNAAGIDSVATYEYARYGGF
jgi:hypothetical protein